MNLLEKYIRELFDIRSTGEAVKETSYYPPLSHLLNEVGKTLKPQVRCIINIKNRGAGIPDGGLFTADQLRKETNNEPFIRQLPTRGVIEVKGTSEDILQIANTEQVLRYLGKYGQVLVTNYRDFVLVGRDIDNKPVKLEAYRLADNESTFWALATNPRRMAEEQGERFLEYLKRVILHAAPLSAPEDVARFLASYARDARSRIEQTDLPALYMVRSALEEGLGLKFEGKKGDHFFHSTLVQTIFYGIFSAWVLWCKQHNISEKQVSFSWREAIWYLRVPMIKALFEQIATPTKLGPLGLVELLNWTGSVLNRVDRDAFFAKFEESHAVQYFYEPFLQAFDPELRKDLGVWYTPPEIVQYMVARIDTALREELEIEDGLADPTVYVLDPCCGTGAYLIEVLKCISTTLQAKGEDALGYDDVKRAAIERIFGFELLPAPFVVAHLQLGLLLQSLGVPLTDSKNERAGVYLTNSLTGWEPPDTAKEQVVQLQLAGIPELKEERDAAGQIKRQVPILVILGNPPYNAFAGVSPDEEYGLVESYKENLISEWGIKKFNLDDLYVRFFRLAEQRIVEKTGKGIICYISNFSYLSDPSFVIMRHRFLKEFDALWFDCMNGDSRETGKLTPDGKPDPSVFSTNYNREGIRVGTAIGLMLRKGNRTKEPVVNFRHFWGVTKRADLLNSLTSKNGGVQYEQVFPNKSNRFSLRPSDVSANYLDWPRLIDIALRPPFAGMAEDRRKALIGIDRPVIQTRLKMYFDSQVSWEKLSSLGTGLTTDVPRFDAKKTRKMLLQSEVYDERRLLPFAMRPFDLQWCYYSPTRPLWREPRPEYWSSYEDGTPALVSRFRAAKFPEGPPITFARHFCDYHMMPPNASIFPIDFRGFSLRTKSELTRQAALIDDAVISSIGNLSPTAVAYLSSLGIIEDNTKPEVLEFIWMHALAISYSSAYLLENADGIQQDWPRIPLPNNKDAFLTSANLGKNVASLLDTEASNQGITSGSTINPEIRGLAVISRLGGGTLNPDAGELAITVGWGHGSRGSATMPGKGKIIERKYTSAELELIEQGAILRGLTFDQAIGCLGETTYDVYLNNIAYWKNIPEKVWDYTIGGYQVIKKWLSYRESQLLGRALFKEEVREVMNMARRIAALLLIGPDLNVNYQLIKHSTYQWPKFGQNEN